MDFSDNIKAAFMDGMDPTYPYNDPYLQDTSSPMLMGFNSQQFPVDVHQGSLKPSLDTGLPSPPLEMNSLQLTYDYPSYVNNASANGHAHQRPLTPPDGVGISPLTSYQLTAASAPDMSPALSSRDSGTQSPPPLPEPTKATRSSARFSPIVPAARRPMARAQRKKRVAADEDSDDDDDDFRPIANFTGSPEDRKESVRRQRIESEQKRRDDLRDGYSRLKEILPPSNMKSSKVVLLERATNQIKFLDAVKIQLERRLEETELEMRRLRRVNDVLMEQRALQPAPPALPGF